MHTPSRPYSPQFDEHYWSGGAAEKAYVYLHANHLQQRFASADAFTVAELGFGTGLTFLLTAQLWQAQANTNAHLTFISYELHPLPVADLEPIHAALPPELHTLATHLRTLLSNLSAGWNVITFTPTLTLHLYVGDALTGLPTHPQPADCWFLDGFSPTHNPALWAPDTLLQVAAHTCSGGTATTYSVAHLIQRNLVAAGFHIEHTAGHPPKRHMLSAVKA